MKENKRNTHGIFRSPSLFTVMIFASSVVFSVINIIFVKSSGSFKLVLLLYLIVATLMLFADVTGMPGKIRQLARKIRRKIGESGTSDARKTFISRYRKDIRFRAKISLYTGLAFNLVYVVIKFVSGVIYSSEWYFTVGIYYLVIALTRFVLLRGGSSLKDLPEDERMIKEYKTYRNCGFLMLALVVAVYLISLQIVTENRSYVYPGYLIYATAAYSMFCYVNAIVNVIRFGKRHEPILSAAKQLSFAAAWMSLYNLQTAMFIAFDGGSDLPRTMNIITGAAVTLYILVAAIFMIIHGNRHIKKLS